MVCDGILDCPDGEDEHNCTGYHCPGRLMCKGLQICVDNKYICDGVVDCLLYGDDEVHCHDEKCPKGCNCESAIASCTNYNLKVSYLPKSTKALLTHNVEIYPEKNMFQKFNNVVVLHFNSNNLMMFRLTALMFEGLDRVLILNITNYKSILLESEVFVGLTSLNNLSFINTTLRKIPKDTFKSIHGINKLDFTFLSIVQIVDYAFCDLFYLKFLNISYNRISTFYQHSFACLENINLIDVSQNHISQLSSDIFSSLDSCLIHLDHASLCCNLMINQCSYLQEYKMPQEYRCKNLIRNQNLKYAIIMIGLTIIILNGLSIIVNHSAKTISKDYICLAALAVADSVIGMFYIISYISDHVYDTDYLRLSNTKYIVVICTYLGIMPCTFSLVSTTITSFMAFQRLLDTKYHHKESHLHMHTKFKHLMFILITSTIITTVMYIWIRSLQFNNLLCLIPTSTVHSTWKIVGLSLSYSYSVLSHIVLFISYVMFIQNVLQVQKIRYQPGQKQRLMTPVIQRLLFIICSHLLGLVCETCLFVLTLKQTNNEEVFFSLLPIAPLLNPFSYTLATVLRH